MRQADHRGLGRGAAGVGVRMMPSDRPLGPICRLTVELEREEDGRWIGEVLELPGVLAYGKTRREAIKAVVELALRSVEFDAT